jgi:hypothetical protein
LEDLRQISSSYLEDLKSAKAEVNKRLEISKIQVAGLGKDLEVAWLLLRRGKENYYSLNIRN